MTNDHRQRVYWEADHGFRLYDHPVVRFFAMQRIRFIQNWLDLEHTANALDIGCGDGFSTYYMYESVRNIWAVDRSHRMLTRHPLKNLGRVAMSDALKLPFGDNTFDLVFGWEMLHHIAEPARAVAEMARVSRRYVLTAEPNRNNPLQFAFALLDREHRWVLHYTLPFMQGLFESVGLQVERAASGGWVFPNKTPTWLLPLLQRLPYTSPIGISNWVLGSKPSSHAV